MEDTILSIITEREVYRALLAERDGLPILLERAIAEVLPPAPQPIPPDRLRSIIGIRRLLGDPIANLIAYGDSLPAAFPEGAAFTSGDGNYLSFADGGWTTITLRISDSDIGAALDRPTRGATCQTAPYYAALQCIDLLVARINPQDYLTSGNAGGQSMSFASLSEILAFYDAMRAHFREALADLEGAGSGRMLRVKKIFVGGVMP